MSTFLTLSALKLMHWMNIRKMTPSHMEQHTGVKSNRIAELMARDTSVSLDELIQLADALDIRHENLCAEEQAYEAVIHWSWEKIESTRKAIHRGGIHYYNYYSVPSPKGHVAPVIIDILCPSDRAPTQNNGHLEPAITVNLGPGDINGLWDEEINEHTWHAIRANRSDNNAWVTGESYLEPSFCPHTYSLVTDEPARIISYTVQSNLADAIEASNAWPNQIFDNMASRVSNLPPGLVNLQFHMDRRGFDVQSLALKMDVSDNALTAFLDGDTTALSDSDLRTAGSVLGADYRIFLSPDHNHDPVGKTWCSLEDATDSIRTYKSYQVASMSMAPQCTDLIGLFVKVDKPHQTDLDMEDFSCSHYFVTGGKPVIHWLDPDRNDRHQELEEKDALWIAPFVQHGFSGEGSLIKLGNGEGLSYLDQIEMSNAYGLANVLKRGRHDDQVWGYDRDNAANL